MNEFYVTTRLMTENQNTIVWLLVEDSSQYLLKIFDKMNFFTTRLPTENQNKIFGLPYLRLESKLV